jgi:hypothetical protein
MKIEEKAMVRNISALKASVIKKLDELEKSALLELQTVSQDSIGQNIVKKGGCFCVLGCLFKCHEFITGEVLFRYTVSTANNLMLVTEKVHDIVWMS